MHKVPESSRSYALMEFGEPRPLCFEILAFEGGVVKIRGVLLVLIVPSCMA